MTSMQVEGDSIATGTTAVRRQGSKQLDLLLLKAESYSKFILDNQQRAQAVQLSLYGTSSTATATAAVVATPPPTTGSAKKSTSKASSSKKRKANEAEEAAASLSSAVTATPVKRAKETIAQPPNLVGGQLMPHQLEGLQWLLSLWENGLNGILADEMGLGKTIQIIALIAHLRHHNTAGPYLIAGPLATISNWVKEFQKWLPSCPVVLYHGDKEYREGLRKQHLPLHSQKQLQFPVVITSFDLCIIDRNHLEKYQWQYIILDEGHRIKNRNCKLLKDLKTFQSVSRLLLTGTPIQNSLEELWSLLNFCSPMIFDDLDIFKSWFDFKNIGEETQVNDILEDEETNRVVTKLHDILRPFVLRRLKHDTIGNQLLSKKEIVIYCGMSRLQQEYYNWVLDNSIRDQLVSLGVKRANRISQLNPQMNLRKVCNHPFLFGNILQQEGDDDEDEEDDDFVEEEEEEEESSAKGGKKRAAKQKKVTNTAASRKKVESSPRKTSSTASTRVISKALDMNPAKLFTHASGKFKLLHRMLPRLRKDGHKVILFSQMTTLLDLIEDYLIDNDLPFVRFDGTTKLQERQDAIDEFNDVNSDVFIFLLSTRSGGLGINLTAADTAIIFDSDWNPHMDSQAQDRCHRIGQEKHVVVYRLLTTASIEIDMMKRQISKKKLERLTIHGGDFRKAGKRHSQNVTIDDLRRLLEDDVNLDRKLTNDNSVIEKHISDAELNLIMDREQLFFEDDNFDNYRPQTSPNSTANADTVAIVEEVSTVVPVEGEMYDIVNTGAQGMVLSLS